MAIGFKFQNLIKILHQENSASAAAHHGWAWAGRGWFSTSRHCSGRNGTFVETQAVPVLRCQRRWFSKRGGSASIMFSEEDLRLWL